MSYKQLIEGQRYQIQAYWDQGLSYRLVAQKTGVSHNTISREVINLACKYIHAA